LPQPRLLLHLYASAKHFYRIGYADSSADIAYVLSRRTNITTITPIPSPSPSIDADWCFPDTSHGILSALEQGVTHIWANTILFSSHPLQTAYELDEYATSVRIIGQPPNLVDKFDDKNYVNSLLRSTGNFTLPAFWLLDTRSTSISSFIDSTDLPYPIIAKPIRGRGSYGVKLCPTTSILTAHLNSLLLESPLIMLEEYLSGEEATLTIMPPSLSKPHYWALPIVVRFNHEEGIAPYNGVVAVTRNSRVLSPTEIETNSEYSTIAKECEGVAELLGVTAPIRIDVRRFKEGSKFAIFDVNMKPNMTGPGRPGREDQASLTAMAAEGLGWDYGRLLEEILEGAGTLEEVKSRE
jgi:D-alanine-D-alanine ligase-like ATP-grasp enzyme